MEGHKRNSPTSVLLALRLNPKIWFSATTDYELTKVLHMGLCGKVVKARCKYSNRMVAIKYISKCLQTEYNCVRAIREIKIMRELTQMDSKFSPELIDAFLVNCETSSQYFGFFLVMEFFENSLNTLMNRIDLFKQKDLEVLVYNLLCALKYLHSANILHRDIKPSNILIDANCNVKICDYGISRTQPSSCIGKGSGNTKRMRDFIMRQKVMSTTDEDDVQIIISQKLASKEHLKKKKRCLSPHVCSRWYRAPEVCLLEKQYDTAVDMWSAGCILYSLLKLFYTKERSNIILFKGDSCFPLSPKSRQQSKGEDDQLKVIFRKLGQLTDEDYSFIPDKQVREFIRQNFKRANNQYYLKDFDSIESTQVLDITKNLILLNPYFRFSASECIKSSIFSQIRQISTERHAPKKIFLECDVDDAFDYMQGTSDKYTKKDYEKMLFKEIREVHSEWMKKNKVDISETQTCLDTQQS